MSNLPKKNRAPSGMWLQIVNRSRTPLPTLMEPWAVGPTAQSEETIYVYASDKSHIVQIDCGKHILSICGGEASTDRYGKIIYDFSDESIPAPSKGKYLHKTMNSPYPGMWFEVINSRPSPLRIAREPKQNVFTTAPDDKCYVYISDENELARLEYEGDSIVFPGCVSLLNSQLRPIFDLSQGAIRGPDLRVKIP